MILALALLSPAPANVPPTTLPAEVRPAETEEEIWALAVRANHPGGYRSYVRRFSQGPNAAGAARRIEALAGRPAAVPLPRQSPEMTEACLEALLARSDNEEMRAYRAAREESRSAAWQRFLAAYPNAICRSVAEASLAVRLEQEAVASPVPGFGPVAAHVLPFRIDWRDYPALARMNDERGVVLVEFEGAENGLAENCRVIRSATVTLDAATCALVLRRVRIDPQRDAEGRAVRKLFRLPVSWRLEEAPEPAEPKR